MRITIDVVGLWCPGTGRPARKLAPLLLEGFVWTPHFILVTAFAIAGDIQGRRGWSAKMAVQALRRSQRITT